MPPLKHAWRRLTQCRELALRLVAVTALLALACDRDAPTGPELKAGNATPLTVSPASLSLPIPPRAGTTLTAQVQFTGTITARTSDAACATVTPLSVPATKPPGSSQYVATFSVTPVETGSCTVTVTDKQGRQARVPVQVSVGPAARIVFAGFGDDPDGDIYLVGTGTTPVRLTNSPGSDLEPSVSPDRTKIAFSSTRDDVRGEIYLMDIDGSNVVRLTDRDGLDFDPVFSPDGARIAFARQDLTTSTIDVWSMNADGSDARKLATSGFPSGYSPDGTTLLYTSTNDDNFTYYAMDAADGANQRALGFGYSPSFSPDGSRIVVVSGGSLSIAHPDGSDPVQITDGTDFHPVFSPSGDRIAFARVPGGHLYLVNPDGSGLAELTTMLSDSPSWR